MNSKDIKAGRRPDEPAGPAFTEADVQAEADRIEASRRRRGWGILGALASAAGVFMFTRGVSNNFNDAMGGSPSDFREKTRKQ